MKITLRISILLNLLLAGGLAFVLASGRKGQSLPALKQTKTVEEMPVNLSSQADVKAASFRWDQLDSGNDYRLFIANLRAMGCPENTIEDIVRGNISRAFAWERRQQRIDGSGNSPWSDASEMALMSSLLGSPTSVSPAGADLRLANQGTAGMSGGQEQGNPLSRNGNRWVAEAGGPFQNGQIYPSSFQNGNGNAAGFASGNQPATARTGQQNPNGAVPQNNNPEYSTDSPSVKASSDPNGSTTPGTAEPPDPLGPNDPFAISSQDIANKDLKAYDEWFQSGGAVPGDDGTLSLNLIFSPE